MEEAFGLLYQEFRRLQTVCVRQAELIKELTEKREIAADMPFTVPIQCTDAGKPDQSEGPFLRSQQKKDLQVAAYNLPADSQGVMVDRNHGKELEYCSKLDIKFPPTNDYYNFLISEPEKLPCLNTVDLPELPTPADESVQGSASNLYDDYRSTYNFNVDRNALEKPTVNIPDPFLGEGVVLSGSDYPFQEKEYSDTFNDSEDVLVPRSLDSAVVYHSTDCASVIPELFIPPEIRGPQQSSWSPHYLPEDCRAEHETTLNSESSLNSQVCEFCQAVFPAGAATRGDYLVHLTGHIECE
ncbi:TRAF family member-associated NF-kappa-B activator [Heterodontus francisci]|uniref:TRAF family member-associated NF-kappa-B activator n=1 Tax=Heterodontus francisci TaxID=7792 RepID=UPI00355ACF5F